MHQHHDFDAFAQSVVDATARGDIASVRDAIRPVARIMAVEHGARFRDLVAGLPVEIWHRDVEIAAALGQSYRANGSPRGQSALGYFRAAEDAAAGTAQVPVRCVVSVLIAHTAALRTLGRLDEARSKSEEARKLIHTRLTDDVALRVTLGAQWALEEGMLRLHRGELDAARSHLEYAHGLASVHLSRAEHIECLGAIAMLDAIAGEVNRTVEQIGYAKDLAEGTELMATGYGAPALIAEVMVANERYDLALSADREPTMMTAASATEWEPFAHAMVGQSRALHGSFVEALDHTEVAVKGYSTWDSPCFGRDFAELLRAALLLGLGHADACWAILQTLPSHEHHALCPARITAQLRIMHGDLLGAEEAIAHCEAMGTEHCARTVVDIHLIRAAIEEARGNTRAADVSADRAFFTLGRTGARAGLQRVPGATLNALAKRALARRHRPEVQRMLTEIINRRSDHDREVDELSPRERHVLAQVQRGVTVAVIAAELYISPNTVKTHLRRIYRKLGVSTRDEAIRAARSLGLNSEITRDSPVLHRVPQGDAVV